ncbi:MAG TPA: hypothetical protein VFB12_14605 [Ktedonobacteraceae bacterium]|nr:hypothetical protein [Ktedonobacteraceae bacterium]
MPAQRGKREWIKQGDGSAREGFYWSALQSYYQAEKLDPGDTALRTKIARVQSLLSEDEREIERRVQTKRRVGVGLTILLFLRVCLKTNEKP